MLGVLLVYSFANFAFFFIDDTYYNSGIGQVGNGERTCTSMFQCFLTTVNYVKYLIYFNNYYRVQDMIQLLVMLFNK